MRFLTIIIFFYTIEGFGQKTFDINNFKNVSFRSITLSKSNQIYISGSKGTVLVSYDLGLNWRDISPENYQEFDFRGIKTIGDRDILIISSGESEKGKAKILKSTDFGRSWKIVFDTNEPGVFLDGISFLNDKHGFVLGDPKNREVFLLETRDGGENWEKVNSPDFPKLFNDEASFAASNTSLGSLGKKVWFITQNRFFVSENKGKNWVSYSTGIFKSASSGLFGSYFLNNKIGYCVGGDYLKPKDKYANFIMTIDGGKTWSEPSEIPSSGLKESVWFVSKNIGIATGPSGTSITKNGGKSWVAIDDEPLHAMVCNSYTCWAIGANAKFKSYSLEK